jgi:hypothetical protein
MAASSSHRHRVGGRHAGELGVAAVDGAPHAAHQRRDRLAGREPAVRVGTHDADAFDAAHPGDLAPDALAEIDLGVVEAECLDLDHHVAGQGRRLGPLAQLELLRTAELLDDDRAHGRFSCEACVAAGLVRGYVE